MYSRFLQLLGFKGSSAAPLLCGGSLFVVLALASFLVSPIARTVDPPPGRGGDQARGRGEHWRSAAAPRIILRGASVRKQKHCAIQQLPAISAAARSHRFNRGRLLNSCNLELLRFFNRAASVSARANCGRNLLLFLRLDFRDLFPIL